MKSNRILPAIFAVCLVFFLITVSIGLPIYIRPFYYAHIGPMGLPEQTGRTYEEIRAAYDEVLDFLTLPGREFGTGVFPYSDAGKDHFVDCKRLFDLNGSVLVISGSLLVMLTVLRKLRLVGPYRLGKRSAAFWGALFALILPIGIGGLAATDFDRAFVVFHSIFFPGKDNWIFDWHKDAIIQVLPQEFFMHCAMLIGGGLLVMSLAVLIWDRFQKT